MFIARVVITEGKDCCKQQTPLDVLATDVHNQTTACKLSWRVRDNEVSEYHCLLRHRATDLEITRVEGNTTLEICEVEVLPLGMFRNFISIEMFM